MTFPDLILHLHLSTNYQLSLTVLPNLYFLRFGPQVLTFGFDSCSPLEMAAAEGHLDTVSLIHLDMVMMMMVVVMMMMVMMMMVVVNPGEIHRGNGRQWRG